MTELTLATVVLAIGLSLGVSGYGGFLVPPLLVMLLGMDLRDAVAHGLLSFVLPGILGAVLYWRRQKKPSWSLTLLLCIGTVPGIVAGRVLSGVLNQHVLEGLLGGLVLIAGIGMLRQRRAVPPPSNRPRWTPRANGIGVGSAGFLGGAAAVLTGVGGPLITVPLLALLRHDVTTLVGAALLNSVFVSVLGAGSLLSVVSLDPSLLVTITLAQLVGVALGVWIQGRVPARLLMRVIAAASITVGASLAITALV